LGQGAAAWGARLAPSPGELRGRGGGTVCRRLLEASTNTEQMVLAVEPPELPLPPPSLCIKPCPWESLNSCSIEITRGFRENGAWSDSVPSGQADAHQPMASTTKHNTLPRISPITHLGKACSKLNTLGSSSTGWW